MRIEGHVGPAITLDGQEGVPFRQGRLGELVVTELHGKFYEQASRGNCYYATGATAGIALLVAATNPNTGHPTLFNPLGSGVNLSIIKLTVTYASGTNAFGGLTWAYTYNAGSNAATAAAITTLTPVASVNALIGSQNVAKAIWSPTTNAFTAAPTVFAGTGIGMVAMTSGATNNPFPLIVDYDGSLAVAPGNAISLTAINATTTALFNVSVLWEEIPV